MQDHFALLNLPRRPGLNPEEIRARFLARSAEVHPDRFHQAAEQSRSAATDEFARLNAAYSCLRDTKERLRHLLELERGTPLPALERLSSAASATDLYFQCGQACRQSDKFLAESKSDCAPLVKAQRFAEGMALRDALEKYQANLTEKRDGLEQQLYSLNAVWDAAPPLGSSQRTDSLPLARLEAIYREMSYVTRWLGQLSERLLRLTF